MLTKASFRSQFLPAGGLVGWKFSWIVIKGKGPLIMWNSNICTQWHVSLLTWYVVFVDDDYRN